MVLRVYYWRRIMLKQLSLVIATSLVLTACGGVENKKDRTPPPTSSAMASSMSSEPASSSSAASSSVASGPTNKILKVSVTDAGTDTWHVQLRQVMPTGLVEGKSYVFSYKVKASEAKSISVAINLGDDNGYAAFPASNGVDVTTEWQTISGEFTSDKTDASVELQANLGNVGTYDIWFDDFSLTEADGTNEQVTNGGIIDAADWILSNNVTGVGALSIEEVAAETPTETPSNDITADLTQGWEVANGGGAITYDSEGVMFVPATPSNYDSGAFFLIPGPVDLAGATITVSVIPDAAFIATGAKLNPFAQLNGGDYSGEYDCIVENADLVEGAVNELTCLVDQAPSLTVTDETQVRVGFQIKEPSGYAGTISIVAAKVVLAE
jgi:hypothetical protein